MKKVFLTAAALLGIASIADAQFVRFGVKGGLNISNAPLETTLSNVSNKIGFGAYVGGLAEVSFNKRSDKFKMQLEANYNLSQLKHGYTFVGSDQNMSTTLHTVNIPLLAKYFFIPQFSLYAESTANLNVSHKFSNTGVSNLPSMSLSGFQLGAMAGANYYIRKGLFVEARYHAVLPEVYETPGSVAYGMIHNVQLGLGYKF